MSRRRGDDRSMSQRREDSELAKQNFQAKTLERMTGAAGGMANNPEFAKGFGDALQNTNKFGMLADFGAGLSSYGHPGTQRLNTLFDERVPEMQKHKDLLGADMAKAKMGYDASIYGHDTNYDVHRLTDAGATARQGMAGQTSRDVTKMQQGLTDAKIADIALKQFESQLPGQGRPFKDIYTDTVKTLRPPAPPGLPSDPSLPASQMTAADKQNAVDYGGVSPSAMSAIPARTASTYTPQVGSDGLLPNQASSASSTYTPPAGQAGGQAGFVGSTPASQMTAADKQNAIDYGGVSPSAFKPVVQGRENVLYGPGDQGTIKSFPGSPRAASMPDQKVIQGLGENIYMSKLPDGTPFYKNAGAFARDRQAVPTPAMTPAAVPTGTPATMAPATWRENAAAVPAAPKPQLAQEVNFGTIGNALRQRNTVEGTAQELGTDDLPSHLPPGPVAKALLGEDGIPNQVAEVAKLNPIVGMIKSGLSPKQALQERYGISSPVAEAVTSGTKPTAALLEWGKKISKLPGRGTKAAVGFVQGLNKPKTSTNSLFPNASNKVKVKDIRDYMYRPKREGIYADETFWEGYGGVK